MGVADWPTAARSASLPEHIAEGDAHGAGKTHAATRQPRRLARLPGSPLALTTMLQRRLFYVGVIAVIWVSVVPADALVEAGIWDKAEHAGAYALLALFGCVAYRTTAQRNRLAVSLVALGIALECVQTQVPGRVGDLGDVLANTIGVLLVYVTYAGATALGIRSKTPDCVTPMRWTENRPRLQT